MNKFIKFYILNWWDFMKLTFIYFFNIGLYSSFYVLILYNAF